MNFLDYGIIALYISGMLLMGYFMREQKSGKSYFVGDKNFGWFTLLLSTMATQLSAISWISVPAFVGLKVAGGMQWLTYELAVPLAMIFVSTVLIPTLYRANIVSAYSYLEKRFGTSTRLLISTVFLISRSFGTGVSVYVVALLLESVFQIQFWQTICIICVVTLVYSLKGGLKVVVYTDVIQMFIKFFGILVCLGFALYNIGGWDNFMQHVDVSRTHVINFKSMGVSGDSFGFIPMVCGGFVLYASYYGCDQTQVQRALAAQSLIEVRKMYLLNGIVRFFVTMTYCLTGLVIGTFVMMTPELKAAIPAGQPDKMMPIFILNYLPNGIIGLVMVAIFAAAMSSLSTTINALSAVTMEDFVTRVRTLTEKQYLAYSQWAAVFWGLVCIFFAFFAGNIADTVIEAINKIGSVFYGPILATFALAALTTRIRTQAVNLGLIVAVLVNLYLWKFQPQVFWFWWNVIGATLTVTIAYLTSPLFTNRRADVVVATSGPVQIWTRDTYFLIGFFVFIVVFCMSIQYWF